MDALRYGAERLRRDVGTAIFARVAGPDGEEVRSRIHDTPGPRWFAPDRPIRTVHADASMFVGGLSALLLQTLHPLAMAAVDQHSAYRHSPWGRLQRTSVFLATTTYGTAPDAQAAVDRVRSVHAEVHGAAPDGRRYDATDPHLLEWVHLAEIRCFLAAYRRYGAEPLTPRQEDGYVADTARVARALGVLTPPTDVAGLERRFAEFHAELSATPAAREAARYLVLDPPLPLVARPAYLGLSLAAVDLLPWWARIALGLPLPMPVRASAPVAGHLLVRGIRWATRPQQPPERPERSETPEA
ncbi:oxygenase MpaB family protein [Streptacidiphilus melanogenes]|uniref:oxygenase MpaB family protein n=1 Tax=Streptacidiphilus melanogenes TaxID=411235 RepID=UPI0005A6BEE6|nr:oxygenase MpaB family protein [Streptacidiphilus melanogenes]